MNRVVYDSYRGRVCPECSRPAGNCRCKIRENAPAGSDGVVRVRREVRRGKPMTVIFGVPLGARELKEFAKELKRKCSSGGTAKDGAIEIQGDHREVVTELLEGRGFTVKQAGG